MSQQHNARLEGLESVLDMLADALRQPLSEASRRSVTAGRRSVAMLFAYDLLRDAICCAGAFPAGLQSFIDGDNEEGLDHQTLQRINAVLERTLSLKARHRAWAGVEDEEPEAEAG